MRNIRAVIFKELIHILRDRKTLVLIALMPLMQVMIYGFGVNTDVKHLRTYVYDQDQTYLSRRLVDSFVHSDYFVVEKKSFSLQDVSAGLNKGRAQAVLIIPPKFTADILKKKGSELQMIIDGSDSTPANVALNSSQAIVSAFLQSERLIQVPVMPITFQPRLWYNPDLKSTFFMLPGLIGLVLQLMVPMITATAIVREKERGNIEQLLVTPIKPYELILGKIIPYIIIGILIAASIVTAMYFMFQVPIRGNIFTLFCLTLVFLIVCLGLGLWASTVADNQQQASQIVMFFAMPSILLSGFIFPREAMPVVVHHIGYFIPLTYFVKIVRGIILKGMGFGDLIAQVWPLLLMAAFVIFFSIKRFGKRIA
ncbi:MAG: ABC transporter permease [Candidatus Omnitrophota bacterium]